MTVGRMAPMDNAIRDLARAPSVWSTARGTIDLERPALMGILHITPDSFSDGGRFQDRDAALRRIEELRSEGADIIDIGGESTRPGARPVSTQEELERVLPIVEAARRGSDVAISIDTTKTEVARAALEAGAEIVNDISGLQFDPEIVASTRMSTGKPKIFPMKDLRDGPTITERPSSAKRSTWANKVRLCSAVFPNPIPGSTTN